MMKNILILTISILSFFFSSFASGRLLSVKKNAKTKMDVTWTYSAAKTMENVSCRADSGTYGFEVFYNDVDLGPCKYGGQNFFLQKPLQEPQTSATFYIQNFQSIPITVSLEPAHFWTPMGKFVTRVIPVPIDLTVNVADSVDFGKLKTGDSKMKMLLSSGDYGNGKGTVTVKPSIANNQMGEIQDKQNKNTINYTVRGGVWDDKAGGWVFKDGLEHDLVINPEKLKLEPGQYAGTVTVTLASE